MKSNRDIALGIIEKLKDNCEPVYGNLDAFGVVYEDTISVLVDDIIKALDKKDKKNNVSVKQTAGDVTGTLIGLNINTLGG